jgi:hypothetical protein
MTARRQKTSTPAVPDRSMARVAGIAVLASLFSFIYYFQHGGLLLYGDAVAHINIARRVVDSQTPGLLQLGTVWLPLPHLLMVPFLWSNSLWQSGAGGSVPSMFAYVFGVLGIFRMVRGAMESNPRTKPVAVLAASVAAFAYGANPNLIYMQATAMTESVYLAFFVWAVVYFSEFIRALPNNEVKDGQKKMGSSLMRSAWCLAGAELTRYDGWFLAGVVGAVAVVIALRKWNDHSLRRIAVKFLLGIALVPLLWLAYNRVVYGNALEFANGPYSAKAIEQRVGAPNPAFHSVGTGAIYFLKSAQLNMADGNWGRFWLAAALLALVVGAWKLRAHAAPLLLLWVPLAFYSLSISYGSVPLHVHTWWPFATFNQRYGLELLPMFAVSIGILTTGVFLLPASRRHVGKVVAVICALMIFSYVSVWSLGPQCLQEAQRNWDIRHNLNSAVQRAIEGLPRNSRYLMDLGEHVGVMEQAGIPLRQVVNNENHRPWMRPTDPDGLWERALADPSNYVDFVVAFDGDVVDKNVNRTNLAELTEIHATGQPYARIYAVRAAPQSR